MKRFMSIAVLVTALVVFGSGMAFAHDYDDHVKIAPNGKGDLLIFPFYAALDGGWDTKLWVINTSQTSSCVAKVIIRSMVNSDELLDFLIYLSPTDVWVGTLTYDSTLGAVIHSEDGSMIAAFDTQGNPIWCSSSNPVHQPLQDPNCAGDTDQVGYVEVIEAWSEVLPEEIPVAKKKIYDAYEIAHFPATICNILAGHMETGIPTAGLTSAIRATTFRDYVNLDELNTTEVTLLGENANNTLAEIEAALSKDDMAMPYDNDVDATIHFFTFPTKLAKYDTNCVYQYSDSPFFDDNANVNGCVIYDLTAYDLEENTVGGGSPFSPVPVDVGKWCNEVNLVVSSNLAFKEGWLRYIGNYHTWHQNGAGELICYSGAPVIATSMNLGASGLSLMYGAWSDGVVTDCGTPDTTTLEYYHYADCDNDQDQVCHDVD